MTERWAAHKDCRECKSHFSNWRCDNGHCVHKLVVCDGKKDCLDGSDEWAGCETATCSNDSSITTVALYKDGDCRRCGNNDEGLWRCNDGKCMFKPFLCDGKNDCSGGEDETIICERFVPCVVNGIKVMTEKKYLESGQCRTCYHEDWWRCNNGQCVHRSKVCDNAMF